MKRWQSQLVFTKQQQVGIVLLVLLLILLLGVTLFYNPAPKNVFKVNSPQIAKLKSEIDSLRELKKENDKPKIYKFNPNFITEYKGYTLGMTPSEIDRLHTYRASGKWINSVNDFKKVTGVSDSLLAVISPYFKFPDWVTTSNKKSFNKKYRTPKSFSKKIDLNKATSEELQKVYGIAETLSKRIIAYRTKLGGFTDDVQLYQVYGLKEETIQEIQKYFTVKTPNHIEKFNINTATASDLATIPGISFDLAKKIWEFRVVRERITHFSELEKIEALSAKKLKLIELYLTLD